MLTARADGYKCKPMIIMPFSRPIPEVVAKFGAKLHLVWAARKEGKLEKWMNDAVTEEYLKRIFPSAGLTYV